MDTDEQIRQKIFERMSERGLRQAQLARQLEISPQALNQILKGQKARVPQSLVDVLDALDLELIVHPKAPAVQDATWDREEP